MSSRPLSPRSLVPALLSLGLTALAAVPQAAYAQKPVLTTLHRFENAQGESSYSTLTVGRDGNFYGETAAEGRAGGGVVFKLTAGGTYSILWSFNVVNGESPNSPLAEGADGVFYGTTYQGGSQGGGTVFRIIGAHQLPVLHSFVGNTGNGVVLGPDGTIYGTTRHGGKNDQGTVWKISSDGTFATLHDFADEQGSNVQGQLVFGPDGALYGTASNGGKNGGGTIYRITTGGVFTLLHSLQDHDGIVLVAGMTVGPDGAQYGVCLIGGTDGTAWKITTAGKFTVLHAFSGDGHGQFPEGALTLSADGTTFYRTTQQGGTGDNGTIFAMSLSGQVTTLYKFHTATDGNTPSGGLAIGPDSALYGTTSNGGAKNGGTIYKLTLPQ